MLRLLSELLQILTKTEITCIQFRLRSTKYPLELVRKDLNMATKIDKILSEFKIFRLEH